MSSPAASTSGEHKKPAEQITFRFCSECSNMLYPKEDEAEHKLMFTCRTCNFSEEATSSCVFRNAMNNAAGETAGVTQDVGSDPTVGGRSSSSSASSSHLVGGNGSGREWSAGRPESAASDASVYASCLGCGRMIVCGVCGERFAMVPASTPERSDIVFLELGAMDSRLGTEESEAVEFLPVESISDLAAFMSQAEDFFGVDDMEMDEEPENAIPILTTGQTIAY